MYQQNCRIQFPNLSISLSFSVIRQIESIYPALSLRIRLDGQSSPAVIRIQYSPVHIEPELGVLSGAFSIIIKNAHDYGTSGQ